MYSSVTDKCRIALKHRIRLLVETDWDQLLLLLGSTFGIRAWFFVCFGDIDSSSLCVPHAILLAIVLGSLLDNLGGSDPRRRKRWAAPKPLKVGSLPPKKRFSPVALRGSVASYFVSFLDFQDAATGKLAANPHKSRCEGTFRRRSILVRRFARC